jgi:hypothetical protein
MSKVLPILLSAFLVSGALARTLFVVGFDIGAVLGAILALVLFVSVASTVLIAG